MKDYNNIDLNNINWNLYSDDTKGYIYTITNVINGKKYVGQTNNPYKRWKKHISESKKKELPYKNYLYSAIKKYGLINFEFNIIDVCDIKDVNEKEIFWIKELKTIVPNGYNLLPGGMVLYGKDNPFYGHKHSDETKEKISKKNTGRKHSKEEIEKMREKNLDEKNPFYNKKHTEETKRKIKEANTRNGNYKNSSDRMKGNQLGKLVKRPKVVMISLESGEVLKIFENAVHAGEYIKSLGLCKTSKPSNSIIGVCNGHERSMYGYFWKYLDDDGGNIK